MAAAGMNWNSGMAGMGGMLGAGLGQLFSNWQNPADSAMPYLQGLPGQLQPYYKPYMDAGQNALSALQGQYGNLLSNPGGMVNQIGQNYQASPGFNFQLQQALKAGNQSAAAGGMAGSPQNQQQNMGLATNLANQNYNQWLQNALGMYGQGLQGTQGLAGIGFNASNEMGQDIGNNLMAQAMLQYSGTNAENQHEGGGLGALFGGLGGLMGGGGGGLSSLAAFF